MNLPWQMVPRYHPQISLWDIVLSLIAGEKDPPVAFESIPDSKCYWLNGATAGLCLALKALGLPDGSGVAVSPYACVTVFEAIASAGLRCVFVDIDSQNFSFDKKSLSENKEGISAVIAIHMFGYHEEIEKIKQILPGCPIIEDCSHAIGSRFNGKQLGFEGAMSVFSFNLNKPVSVGQGGLLVVNKKSYFQQVQSVIESQLCLNKQGVRSMFTLAAKTALFKQPWYGLMATLGLLSLDRKGAMSSQVDLDGIGRFYNNLLIRKLPRSANCWDFQRNWATKLSSLMDSPAPLKSFVDISIDWNGYLLPILVDTPLRRDDSLSFFHKNNVDAFLLWPESIDTSKRFGYRKGQCPVFEDVLRRLLFLPCYAEMTGSQCDRVKRSVKQWMQLIKK